MNQQTASSAANPFICKYLHGLGGALQIMLLPTLLLLQWLSELESELSIPS